MVDKYTHKHCVLLYSFISLLRFAHTEGNLIKFPSEAVRGETFWLDILYNTVLNDCRQLLNSWAKKIQV